MARLFHLSSRRNRESIEASGLDPARMKNVPGLAGSVRPEIDGVFVFVTIEDAEFFAGVAVGNHPEGLDLWQIEDAAIPTSEHGEATGLPVGSRGYPFLPAPVSRDRIRCIKSYVRKKS
jgi:hypothetical protein